MIGSNLPSGWREESLAEIVCADAPIQYGILQPGPDIPDGVPYVRPTEIQDDEIAVGELRRTTEAIARRYRRSALEPGDVLLSIVGSIGKVAVVPPVLRGANITQSSARLRPRCGVVSTDFLAWFLRSPEAKRQFDEVTLGTGVPRLNIGDIRKITIPFPPIAEQERIAATVRRLTLSVDAVEGYLQRVAEAVSRFRQAVVIAACQGRLTQGWRSQRGPHTDEAMDVLLKKASDFVSAQTLVRRRRAESPVRSTCSDILPNAWKCAFVKDLAVVVSGQTPKNIQQVLNATGPLPWFTVGDMNAHGNERVMKVASRWLPGGAAEQLGLRSVPAGAIIFPKRGGAIATNKKRILERESCLDLNTMAMVPYGPLAPYLEWWFQSVDLSDLSNGSNVPQINHPDIEMLTVPVPPMSEQCEIVRRLEALYKAADRIEAQVAAAIARVGSIRPAVLARAFSGELNTGV